MRDLFDTVVFYICPLFFAIVLHEISHGLAAYTLGDDTAQRAGRFKLYTHFDLWGSFLIPLGLYLIHSPFLIGYAKPVPIDPRNFKDPIPDMALVGAAGPLCNLVLGLASVFLLYHVTSAFLVKLLMSFMLTNFALFFFNLIPIPPLDGSRILAAVLPTQYLWKFYQLEPFGFFIIMGLELLTRNMSELIGYNIGLFHLCIEIPTRGLLNFLLS